MAQEITLSREHYGELDEFRPELFRRDMAQVRALSDVALRELRKEQRALAADIEVMNLDPETAEDMREVLRDRYHEVLSRVAHLRAVHVTKAVAYYDANVQPAGGIIGPPPTGRYSEGHRKARQGLDHLRPAGDLAAELGFDVSTIRRWGLQLRSAKGDSEDPDKLHPEQYAEWLVNAWLKSAGIIETKSRQTSWERGDTENEDQTWVDEMMEKFVKASSRRQELLHEAIAKHRKGKTTSAPFGKMT